MKTTLPTNPPEQERRIWQDMIRELAVGKTHYAVPMADSPNAAHWLADFTRGNLMKRVDKLKDQIDLTPNPFPDLDGLLEQYVREVPLRAFDVGTTDSARFARWLWRHFLLSAEQRDALRIVRCHCAVEYLARQRRLAYLRFHERHQWSVSAGIDWQRATQERMRLMVNPARVRTAFETRVFLDDDHEAEPRASQNVPHQPRRRRTVTAPAAHIGRHPVVFFAVAGEIASVELAESVFPVLEMLARPPLRTLTDWIDVFGAERICNPDFALEEGDFVELVEAGVACGLFACF